MEALTLTVFVSLVLAAGAVGLFAWLVEERTLDHADRLALLPLESERRAGGAPEGMSKAPTKGPTKDMEQR